MKAAGMTHTDKNLHRATAEATPAPSRQPAAALHQRRLAVAQPKNSPAAPHAERAPARVPPTRLPATVQAKISPTARAPLHGRAPFNNSSPPGVIQRLITMAQRAKMQALEDEEEAEEVREMAADLNKRMVALAKSYNGAIEVIKGAGMGKVAAITGAYRMARKADKFFRLLAGGGKRINHAEVTTTQLEILEPLIESAEDAFQQIQPLIETARQVVASLGYKKAPVVKDKSVGKGPAPGPAKPPLPPAYAFTKGLQAICYVNKAGSWKQVGEGVPGKHHAEVGLWLALKAKWEKEARKVKGFAPRWVGFTQNGAPCKDCYAFFLKESATASAIVAGFAFLITADQGGYRTEPVYASVKAQPTFGIYFMNGAAFLQ
jgi:hypothetical protein